MSYKINLGGWGSVFAVPSALVDNYIKIASGNAVKVLLFFLRNSDRELDAQAIAKYIDIKAEDVEDALVFWKQIGLLCIDNNQISPSDDSPAEVKRFEVKTTKSDLTNNDAMKSSVRKVELQRSPVFSPIEIADSIKDNEKVDFLFKTCERLYGRTLKHTEQNALVTILEHTGLCVEVTLMLVEYCFSVDKATPAYMKNVALDWFEKDIKTISDAENQIKYLTDLRSAENQIKSLFEINRALTPKEKGFIDRWVIQWKMPYELITFAYEENVDKIGKLSFPYMEKILSSWKEKGFSTIDQVKQEKENWKNQNKTESSFDIDELDRQTLEEYKRNL